MARANSLRIQQAPGSGDLEVQDNTPVLSFCYGCHRGLKSPKALMVHRVRAHARASQHALRIVTEWCPACLRFFHEQRRAVHHAVVDAP
eukprot:1206746-Alexandrium_andersonii.AAC.1